MNAQPLEDRSDAIDADSTSPDVVIDLDATIFERLVIAVEKIAYELKYLNDTAKLISKKLK